MEPTVEIDACFSTRNIVDAAVVVIFDSAGSQGRSARGEISLDMSQIFDGGTLKRNTSASAPRLDLSQSDLVRLLSYLEGELQARDVVIAALKSEKAKKLLYQAKYGHLHLNDPLAALQRDSDLCGENEELDETSIGSLYENQLGYLERLVTVQRRSHFHAKQILSFVEIRHNRIIRELERERKWRAEEEAVQGDDVSIITPNAREYIEEELELQKQQCRQMHLQLIETKEAMLKDQERHRAVVLYLHKEYERLLNQMEAEYRRMITSQESMISDQTNKATDQQAIETLKQEISVLKDELNKEKQQVLDLRRTMKKQEDELNLMRSLASPGRLPVPESKLGHATKMENGALKNGKQKLEGSNSHSTETTIGVALQQPQQRFHASGVFRRSSTSSISSPARSKLSVLLAAKNYISHAANRASGRRLASSVSPPLKRWTHRITNSSQSASSPPKSASAVEDGPGKKRSGSLSEPIRPEPTSSGQQSLGAMSKLQLSSSQEQKQAMEPEIAELEAVLKSLALAVNVMAPGGSGRVQFPDVGHIPTENGVVNKAVGHAQITVPKERRKSDVGESTVITNGTSHQPSGSGKVPTFVRLSNSASSAVNDTDIGKKQRPPRIPIGIHRKLPKSSNELEKQTARTSSSSVDQLHQPKSEADENKSQLLGCSSPHLTLQRKVKAISGLASRIQRRVVAGVVNQVEALQRPGGLGS